LVAFVTEFSSSSRNGSCAAYRNQALVDERGPGGLRLADLRWSAVFRIHRREAARFRNGRVFLLGDAAHIHSPVGGQGMNMAFRTRSISPGS